MSAASKACLQLVSIFFPLRWRLCGRVHPLPLLRSSEISKNQRTTYTLAGVRAEVLLDCFLFLLGHLKESFYTSLKSVDFSSIYLPDPRLEYPLACRGVHVVLQQRAREV